MLAGTKRKENKMTFYESRGGSKPRNVNYFDWATAQSLVTEGWSLTLDIVDGTPNLDGGVYVFRVTSSEGYWGRVIAADIIQHMTMATRATVSQKVIELITTIQGE
jgi:hypothetical protein